MISHFSYLLLNLFFYIFQKFSFDRVAGLTEHEIVENHNAPLTSLVNEMFRLIVTTAPYSQHVEV